MLNYTEDAFSAVPKKRPRKTSTQVTQGFHPKYGSIVTSDKVSPSPEYDLEEVEFGKTAIYWNFTQYLGDPGVINYQRFTWNGSFSYVSPGVISGRIDSITRAYYQPRPSQYGIDGGLPSDASNEVAYKYSVTSSGSFSGHEGFLRVTEETMDDHQKMSFGYEFASHKVYSQAVELIPGPRSYTVVHDKSAFAQNGLGDLTGDWWATLFSSNLA